MANVLHCDIVVSEFNFQSHYYIYFQTNTIVNKSVNDWIQTPIYKLINFNLFNLSEKFVEKQKLQNRFLKERKYF